MSRHRILVVDDDSMFRNLMMGFLRQDYIVSVATDGLDAYQKALSHPPDLAIIDVQMPEWDGVRTLQEFRKHPTLAGIPVMMLTGDATKQTVIAAVQAGASDYVVKTHLVKKDLLSKIETLLRNRALERLGATGGGSGGGLGSPPRAAREPAPSQAGIADAIEPAAVATTAVVAAPAVDQALLDNWE